MGYYILLNPLLVIVVGGGIQVILVETKYSDWVACRLPVFLRKGETKQ